MAMLPHQQTSFHADHGEKARRTGTQKQRQPLTATTLTQNGTSAVTRIGSALTGKDNACAVFRRAGAKR